MFMPSYLQNELILVRYPFSDLSSSKVRPAIIVNAPHISQDIFIVPLTSRTASLLPDEFLLADWAKAGLNAPSAVKRGIYTVHPTLVIKTIGTLTQTDGASLQQSLREWLGLS
jgi:mRNA interferase MazF